MFRRGKLHYNFWWRIEFCFHNQEDLKKRPGKTAREERWRSDSKKSKEPLLNEACCTEEPGGSRKASWQTPHRDSWECLFTLFPKSRNTLQGQQHLGIHLKPPVQTVMCLLCLGWPEQEPPHTPWAALDALRAGEGSSARFLLPYGMDRSTPSFLN